MKQIRDTAELVVWLDKDKEQLKNTYNKRIKSLLCTSKMIEKSIAYHTINERAIEDNYNLTECQINKLALLIMG